VASLGTLVGILNASTLIIALPTMMVKLNTSLIDVTWVLIVYMLILTILAPACNPHPDFDLPAETSKRSTPTSCAQASFAKNESDASVRVSLMSC